MLKCRITHKIGDVVEHSFNEKKFKVVGYNYIDWNPVKYICLQDDKVDLVYFDEIEIKPHRESFIWFQK